MPTPSGSDAPKNIGGSDAAPQEAKNSQSANAGQSHCVRPVFSSQRPVPFRGKRAAWLENAVR